MFNVIEGSTDPSLPIVSFILDEDEAEVVDKYTNLSHALTDKLAWVYRT